MEQRLLLERGKKEKGMGRSVALAKRFLLEVILDKSMTCLGGVQFSFVYLWSPV